MPHEPGVPLAPASVCVIMPTWGEAHFIARAIDSLRAQTLAAWRLVVIDDASPDATRELVEPMLADPRIVLRGLPENVGLGAALNIGLDWNDAQVEPAPAIAYLPADDLYHPEHLEELLAALGGARSGGSGGGSGGAAMLAYSGVRHDYNRMQPGILPEHGLQLVQCLHRRTALRWTERATLVSDDLERLFFARLAAPAERAGTGRVSCEWVAHPDKRHHILREPAGGINTYRHRYGVRAPLRFHASTGNLIDEVRLYRRDRERPSTPRGPHGLKIVLAGELAYNPDRVLALEEAGHTLYGLWMERPYWYNSVGPMPFGHVTDLPRHDWQAALRRIRPDVILAGLNWQAVPFVHHVREQVPEVPFIWHFKEGPFICLEKGTWAQLIDLYRKADGVIWIGTAMRDWFETVLPGITGRQPALLLDGDLPRRRWFADTDTDTDTDTDADADAGKAAAPRAGRRGRDGIHTVVPGRPIGLHPECVAALAAHDVHLHFYGDFTQGQWRGWIERTRALAPRHLHLHAHVDVDRWVAEFAQYDAGWLHVFASQNRGELRRALWDDLNLPARMATFAAAGLPMLQRRNAGHIVASRDQCAARGEGLFFDDLAEAAAQLQDTPRLAQVRERVRAQREDWCFDSHVPRLVEFMRAVIRQCQPN